MIKQTYLSCQLLSPNQTIQKAIKFLRSEVFVKGLTQLYLPSIVEQFFDLLVTFTVTIKAFKKYINVLCWEDGCLS